MAEPRFTTAHYVVDTTTISRLMKITFEDAGFFESHF
jgi:hypothetical protein